MKMAASPYEKSTAFLLATVLLLLVACKAHSTRALIERDSWNKGPGPIPNSDCSTKFGPFIEGAAVDKSGRAYAINWGSAQQRNTIGFASDSCGLRTIVDDVPGTLLNGLRVLPDNTMLAVDQANGRLVFVNDQPGEQTSYTYCDGMQAPNDLAFTSNGRVYVSGQNWTDDTQVGDGGIWMCTKRRSKATRLASMGRTNGIDVSPDDKNLYVSEAFNVKGWPVSNKIWKYTLEPNGELGVKELFHDFTVDGEADVDVDGMRTDVDGNLYVTRHGAQKVVKFRPDGLLAATYTLSFSHVTNLEMGGPNGKSMYVVGRCGMDTVYGQGDGCVAQIMVDAPGRYWSLLQRDLPRLG